VATASSAAESVVPERPQLAATVALHGELKESGFEQAQWLAEREGRFIQLTELLYRVLELCDGEHTLDEIAEEAGAATGRNLSAENVAYLLTTRLIPTRLVEGIPGAVLPSAPGAPQPTRAPARSPLSVNLRFAPFSPRLVNGAAEIFKYLFTPLILVLLVLAGLAGQFWLYRIHHFDLQSNVTQAFAHPNLLVGALGLTLLATIFHELGHASALRYGGGQARRMGMGFYLGMPVFYTDVSENYRLGRWARVRTDLGGFYFNLVADLILFGLYFVTHQEVLLFAVAATNVEILFNLVPLGRFDGYWALADLTGIPDFFSLMGPFLRSLVPLPFLRGQKLPRLKTWVRAVYALYTLIAVPALALIFAKLLLIIPSMLPEVGASLGSVGQAIQQAHDAGDGSALFSALANMAVLLILLIPLLYMALSLARMLLALLIQLPKRLLARRPGVA
jgi:putative peptide zinc metalloprotease protein